MKILITYLFSIFSVAVFLGVTSGFTVYSHYCNDTAIINHCLIESQAICNHPDVVADCKIQNTHSCCKTDNHIATTSNNCCTDNKHFYKISDVYNITSPSEDEICKNYYTLISSLVRLNLELKISNSEPVVTYSLPPPLSGKQIVLLYQQLKASPNTFVV